MIKKALLLFCLALVGCASDKPPSYADTTRNYTCAQIRDEIAFLDRSEKNLQLAKKDTSMASDAGAVILTIGFQPTTQSSEINRQIQENASQRNYMKRVNHEKCK